LVLSSCQCTSAAIPSLNHRYSVGGYLIPIVEANHEKVDVAIEEFKNEKIRDVNRDNKRQSRVVGMHNSYIYNKNGLQQLLPTKSDIKKSNMQMIKASSSIKRMIQTATALRGKSS